MAAMSPVEQQEYSKRFHRFVKRYEAIYVPQINRALRTQVEQFAEHGTVYAITSVPIYEVLTRLYVECGTIWAAYTHSTLRRNKSRQPMGFSERIAAYMRSYFTTILNLAQKITDTTKEIIRRILDRAVESGASFDEIVKEVRQSTELGPVRARLIARTEVVAAANKAALDNAKSTGLPLNKFWISTKDSRTRHIPEDKFDHRVMNGVVVPIDALFEVQGEQLAYPGDKDHGASGSNCCNCRCTVAFRVI